MKHNISSRGCRLTITTLVRVQMLPIIYLLLSHINYHPVSSAFLLPQNRQTWIPTLHRQPSHSFLSKSSAISDNTKSVIPTTNQLTHAMICVPNVNITTSYWCQKYNATLESYRQTPQGQETAFVGFGGGFSLEVTKARVPSSWKIGNSIQYYGLSMLLNFDLTAAVLGQRKASTDVDPNGWMVKFVAAAPGDSFSRFCLRVKKENGILASTSNFYCLLGMKEVAVDGKCVCLRYDDSGEERKKEGVRVTLVFEEASDEEELEIGNAFDHLAISTESVEAIMKKINASGKSDQVFMPPTPMFGTQCLGVLDPNGYKVYFYESK